MHSLTDILVFSEKIDSLTFLKRTQKNLEIKIIFKKCTVETETWTGSLIFH